MEDKDKIYWNQNMQSYTTEFPYKDDRLVYMQVDNAFNLKEALSVKNAIELQIKSLTEAGVKRGVRPLKKALIKLDESIYVSQRY